MNAREEAHCRCQWILRLALLLTVVIACCAKTDVQVAQRITTGIETGDGITVILDYRGGTPDDAHKLEKAIGQCVSEALKERRPGARFIDPVDFRRAVFPGMDVTSAPRSPESIFLVLDKPQVRDAVKALNLRYLVCVKECTSSTAQAVVEGRMMPLALGVFQEKKTVLSANVIDLRKACDSGDVTSTATDVGYYGFISILPVAIPAFTESRACKSLGMKVVEMILNASAQPTERQSEGGTQ